MPFWKTWQLRNHKNHLDIRRNYFLITLYYDISKLDLHATKLITILISEKDVCFVLSRAHYPPISWISGILQRAEI